MLQIFYSGRGVATTPYFHGKKKIKKDIVNIFKLGLFYMSMDFLKCF